MSTSKQPVAMSFIENARENLAAAREKLRKIEAGKTKHYEIDDDTGERIDVTEREAKRARDIIVSSAHILDTMYGV